MTNSQSTSTKCIDQNSDYLILVKDLGRRNAATLGFFPEGAFNEYAAKKHIIVAIGVNGEFLGYLLFRITPSRQEASIVHLCIETEKQGQGIAKTLVKELINSTNELRGISLRCRRDFAASKLWPKLNFSAVSESAGKSASGSILTRWWYQHKNVDLFTPLFEKDLTEKLKVVIDANIFYDIKNQADDESMALLADYLEDSIVICITSELFNEIDRSTDAKERIASKNFTSQFPQLSCSLEDFEQVYNSLKPYLPPNPKIQDISDFSHLARAIHANVKFFVTKDRRVLDKSDELYKEFGVLIIRPVDLIVEIDSLYREQEYQPARLAGTLYEIAKVQPGHEDLLVNTFQANAECETKSLLRTKLRNLLLAPKETDCLVAWSLDKKPLGLISYTQAEQNILTVHLIRVAPNHELSTTILRYLIGFIMKRARTQGCNLIEVVDTFLSSSAKDALLKDYFFPLSNLWFKYVIPTFSTKDEVVSKLASITHSSEEVAAKTSEINALLSSLDGIENPAGHSSVEEILWPAKIKGSSIPCYVVPIQPQWAMHLFDENFANQDIFGAKVDLALSREGVYYRAKMNSAGISAPARIIWYVSQKGSRYTGAGAIRAHSRLDEIVVGKPKDLFKQFRRLGIYEWKDVFATAKNNISNEIMALRFSDTEMLSKCLSWDEITQKLDAVGVKTQLQSPCKIPEDVFFSIISSS